jgi:hypothetical protein
LVAQRIEIIGKFMMIQARTSMEQDDRISHSALNDEKAGIPDVDISVT